MWIVEEYVKWCRGEAVGKILTLRNYRSNNVISSTNLTGNERKKGTERISMDFKKPRDLSIIMYGPCLGIDSNR